MTDPDVDGADPAAATEPESRFASLIGHRPAPVSPIPREAQAYQGHRAGIVTRFAADAIDFGVLVAVLVGMYIAWSTLVFLADPRDFSFPPVTFAIAFVVGAVVLGAYLTFGWWLTGKTYGKHVMGLRVVNFDGRRLHFVGAAARAAFCVVFPLGLFWVLVSRANRSVQDVVIRTSVIYDWSVRLDPKGPAQGG